MRLEVHDRPDVILRALMHTCEHFDIPKNAFLEVIDMTRSSGGGFTVKMAMDGRTRFVDVTEDSISNVPYHSILELIRSTIWGMPDHDLVFGVAGKLKSRIRRPS